jgi:predicted nucleotidyltransferase
VQLLNSLSKDYAQFGIKSMSLFGSMARDEAALYSDIDILVEFIDMPTFDNYMNLKLYLEDLFGRKVDLVEKETLHPSLRSAVERELIEIAALPTVSRRHIG